MALNHYGMVLIQLTDRAQLAISNLKGIYTHALLQPSESPSQVTSGAAVAPTASSSSSLPKPTTLIKDPNVIQPPNQYCQILRLQGTKENNIKAEKLQLYVAQTHNKHLAEINLFI